MPCVTIAIGNFLRAQEHNAPELISRWNPAMETQVNIRKADGWPAKDPEGNPLRNTYENDRFRWWNIRVPKKANSEPEWNDYELNWPLDLYAEGIGSTGWDWQERVSRWVGFDFDAITKATGISDEQLTKVKQLASSLEYVEVRKSTSGTGLHLYVFLDGINTANHDEHAQLASAVLTKMSRDCGFNFADSVDVCGGNMWIWARKMSLENEGLKLLKPATETLSEDDLPDWHEQIQPPRGKIVPPGDGDSFHELTSCSIQLDERHKATIDDVGRLGYVSVWHPDLQCWHTHTKALQEIAKMRGIEFTTISRGTDRLTPNCYCFPKESGWAVYRFNNAKEHGSWRITNGGCVTRDFDFSVKREIDRFTFRELLTVYPCLNPPVIDGLIREGETCNLISYSKIGKSWLGYGMLLSVVTGQHWLGRFATTPGNTLLIDNELHRATLSNRIPLVADRLKIPFNSYEEHLHIWPLRGNLKTLDDLDAQFRAIEHGKYKLIVFDAMYRFAIDGVSENDNAAMARFYNQLDNIAERTKAAIVLIHHAAKGDQGHKRVTDVGAGAGAQSRAADCHLILREHEDPDSVVLEAAVRSFGPVKPLTLSWDFPVWQPSDADPAKLKTQPTRSDRRQAARDREGFDAITQALQEGPATLRKLRGTTGIGKDRLERLAGMMAHSGKLIVNEVVVRGNSTNEYQLSA